MKLKGRVSLAIAVVLCAMPCLSQRGCEEIRQMAALARAQSVSDLQTRKQIAPDNYRAKLIFAARHLEIDRQERETANQFLNMIPSGDGDPHQTFWLDLAQSQDCTSGGILESDLKPLFRLQYHLPRIAARAVLLAPERMAVYVSYALIATWPDSDYAVRMRSVCFGRRREFVEAVSHLEPKDKQIFVSRIFNPQGCRTIFYPEQ